MSRMRSNNLSTTEYIFLVLALVIILAGIALFYWNESYFNWYVREDHLVEWLTVAGLLSGSVVCLQRFFKLLRIKKRWFLFVQLMLGILLVVAAGEEISWGQRLLGIKSSEYFLENNAQGETNFHNLVVDGVKLNKLIFSTLLSVFLGLYLVILPLLYYRNSKIRSLTDKTGIPVPRIYQVIAFAIIVIITSLFRHEKSPELLECGAALLFFLIIRYPANHAVFEKQPGRA